jgi:hypothetical protein
LHYLSTPNLNLIYSLTGAGPVTPVVGYRPPTYSLSVYELYTRFLHTLQRSSSLCASLFQPGLSLLLSGVSQHLHLDILVFLVLWDYHTPPYSLSIIKGLYVIDYIDFAHEAEFRIGR